MLCDFCSAPDPVLSFDAKNFVLTAFSGMGVTQQSDGNWAACATCGELVAAKKWELLSVRVALTFIAAHPEIPASVDELADELYGLYAGMLAGELTGGISAEKGMARA